MPIFLRLLVGLAARVLPGRFAPAGLPPWQFGMTPQQVSGFPQHAPYYLFANGDLETYSGIFDGKRQNVQFFFSNNRLKRIGVNLYEGTNAEDGRLAWVNAYHALARQYGRLDLTAGPAAAAHDPEVLSHAAKHDVLKGGMQQVTPVQRLPGMSVFATYAGAQIKGQQYFYVLIILESLLVQ